MSNKVTYIFVAEDKFTQVAERIAKSVDMIDSKMKGLDEKFKNVKMDIKFDDVTNEVDRLSNKLDDLQKKLKNVRNTSNKEAAGIQNFLKKVANFSEKITRTADQFGMMAYFQLMNIEFPMAILVKLGNEYADAMGNAKDSIDMIFSKTKGYSTFQKNITDMAEQFGRTTRFSAAQVMSVASLIANMTNNMESVQVAVPAILRYTIGTGQMGNLQGAARQFMSGVLSGHLPRANILLTGGSAFQRFKQAIDEVNKRYAGILGKDSKSASAQLAILSNTIKELASSILEGLNPALESFNQKLQKIVNPLSKFVKTHKSLMIVLAKGALITTGFLVSLVALGAVLGALSLPFHLIKFAVLGLSAAFEMSPIGRFITLASILVSVVTVLMAKFKGFRDVMMFIPHKLEAAVNHVINPEGKAVDQITPPSFSDLVARGGKMIVHIFLQDNNNVVKSIHTSSPEHVKTHVSLGHNMGAY